MYRFKKIEAHKAFRKIEVGKEIKRLEAEIEIRLLNAEAQELQIEHDQELQYLMNKDLDAYFTSFEHTAMKLECPKDKWTVVPSTVLTGKAQVAYGNMD